MVVFDFISLSNGIGDPLKIQTNEGSTEGAKEGFYITDFDGLLDPGQSTGSAEGNGLTDGSGLDEGVTVTGKTLTMNVFMGHSDRTELRKLYMWFIEFLQPKNFILTTDWVELGIYNAQYVSFILDEDGKGKNNSKFFKGTLTLVTEEAW